MKSLKYGLLVAATIAVLPCLGSDSALSQSEKDRAAIIDTFDLDYQCKPEVSQQLFATLSQGKTYQERQQTLADIKSAIDTTAKCLKAVEKIGIKGNTRLQVITALMNGLSKEDTHLPANELLTMHFDLFAACTNMIEGTKQLDKAKKAQQESKQQ